MQRLIEEVRKAGDTVGGVIACRAESLPTGWGEPLFDKLHARWGQALLSINAAKGFEVGSGFAGSRMRGSQHNDPFVPATTADALRTRTNHSGGVQGGISTGMPLYGRVAFKPVATLLQPYPHATDAGAEVVVQGKGRHDPCVVPRAVPIVEAMTALTLMDFALLAATG
jgi:chorismate synthase